ncbi:hypothetical protein V1509DRAFT_634704 [Lipomyces kononenkoae]
MKSLPSLNDYFYHSRDVVSSNNGGAIESAFALASSYSSSLTQQIQMPLWDMQKTDDIIMTSSAETGLSRRVSTDEICDLNDTEEIISTSTSTVTDAKFSPFVSDDLSTATVLSPLLVSIVHAALDVPLSPMTTRRKAVILDAIVAKNIPTAIFYEMAAVYDRRAEILSKGFSLKYLAPVGKQRNRGRPKGHVKRPLNSFMIYRRVQTYLFHASSRESANCDDESGIVKLESSLLLGDLERTSHQSVSVIIGQFWRTESQTVRDAFARLAEQESSLHRELHPDYKYCPQKRARRHSSTSSSGSTALAKSHKPSKTPTPVCQQPRLILPSTSKPKLTEQCDVQESYSLETTGMTIAMPHSSPIFTPIMSPEDLTLPRDAIDDVWPTVSHYDQSDASSGASPEYVCVDNYLLSSSPERDLSNHHTLRIANDYCMDNRDDDQADTYDSACRPESCLATNYLQRTRPPYLINAVTESSLSIMDQSNSYLAGKTVADSSPSFAQHLVRSRNTPQDSGYDEGEQNFNRDFNMWTGNNYCVDTCT